MYDKSLEQLIDAVIADGVITDQERKVVYKKAASLGIDQDEIEVYLEGRLESIKNSKDNKSGKIGYVKTCPNCGSVVTAGELKCQECGFFFTEIGVISSAKELDNRLSKVIGTGERSDSKRANIIRSFPIPNSKEDLIEFMTSLEPKALTGIRISNLFSTQSNLTKAYYEKFTESLNKAHINLSDERATIIFSERLKSFKNKGLLILCGIIFLLVSAIIGIISGVSSYNEKIENQKALVDKEYERVMNELYALEKPDEFNYTEIESELLKITWNPTIAPTINGNAAEKYACEKKGHYISAKRAIADQIFSQYKKDYGKREAEDIAPEQISHSFYIHD